MMALVGAVRGVRVGWGMVGMELHPPLPCSCVVVFVYSKSKGDRKLILSLTNICL